MENILRSKELWSVVELGIQELATGTVLTDPQKVELEARKLKDLKAKNFLFQAIECPILETTLCKDTSKDIWDSLNKKYEGSLRVTHAQLQVLKKEFELL